MKIVIGKAEWFPVPDYYLPELETKAESVSDVPAELVNEYERAKAAFTAAAVALYEAARPGAKKEVWGWL